VNHRSPNQDGTPPADARTYSVAVVGAAGYAGGEFLRLAIGHPNLKIGALTGKEDETASLGQVHPHLRSLADRQLVPTTPEVLAGHDIVVLAVPHGVSGEIAKGLPEDVLVLDLGADHRLIDPAAWEKYYGSAHAGTWTYGLPELINGKFERALGSHGEQGRAWRQRELLSQTDRIAVPGCNVTAVTLGLQPGIAEGVLAPTDLVAVLANGYSGAGKALAPHLTAAEGLGAATPYSVGGTHRHIPEIAQNLAIAGGGLHAAGTESILSPSDVAISFTPTLVPMSRGILATASGRLTDAWQVILDADDSPGKERTKQWLRSVWEDAYRDEPFVHLLPEGQWPSTAMTLGTNQALVQVALDLDAGRVVTITALDNLVKGTAGGAIQSMNLALGLPETTGLPTEGVAP